MSQLQEILAPPAMNPTSRARIKAELLAGARKRSQPPQAVPGGYPYALPVIASLPVLLGLAAWIWRRYTQPTV
jgi:hypothetical protein